MSTSSVGQLLFTKYVPPAATVLVLWDHCLTLDEELAIMWKFPNGQILTRAVYIMNRYFTEMVMLYTAYVFAGLKGPIANKVGVWRFRDELKLIIGLGRAYQLLDHKPTVRKFFLAIFVACIAGTFILSVETALTLVKTQIVLPPKEAVCTVYGVPKTTPSLMGTLLLFNLFVTLVSFYNALERPRRYESEVFDSLWRDGAKIYSIVSLLWTLLLISSVFAEMTVFFPILILAWSVKANLTSRMHLRIESLRLSDIAHPITMYTAQEG
ncbi:uncharacterized protein EV420DRAFT_1723276 [Desarmillaria tabescens]|uniref:DUF6533 domain-containing protein n=1 Tax=Armillaria tabescens TaxID=1929756 RepID=A0AA39JJI3_ARMTA|nr:uncharacterized protein EV420DRAFT_1723276 [Desarmillaria tabescens]KAK0443931.1 hypothetical protein EV420DRAFT_1723276 [Desarmillaria tabescens]